MNLFKNVIQDGLEYNNMIKKYNSKNQLVDIAPIEVDKVITITLEEYKELLIYKGKYLGLVEKNKITKLYADGIVVSKEENNNDN